jgi:hypothetical protein
MLLHPERSSRWIAGGCFDGWASCPSNSGVWIQVKLLPSHCLRSDEPRRSPAHHQDGGRVVVLWVPDRVGVAGYGDPGSRCPGEDQVRVARECW